MRSFSRSAFPKRSSPNIWIAAPADDDQVEAAVRRTGDAEGIPQVVGHHAEDFLARMEEHLGVAPIFALPLERLRT